MRDLLIAGGGPAGLATALHAARCGLDVAVWEPRDGTIDKACGEGLMPGALRALLDLGVDPPGQELTGISYLAGSHCAAAAFAHGPGRGVRRTTLHEAMRQAAADAGVRVERRKVTDVWRDRSGVVVDGNRARYLVAADGLHSPVRRGLGLDAGPGPQRRFGLRRHFEVEAWTTQVEVHWSDTAEAYVTPVSASLVGVAVLTSRRGTFEEHLDHFPGLRLRLAGARAGEVLGAGPLRQRATRRRAGGVLLVGDAAGYVDALTGEGVALAMAEARAAVQAIVEGDPARYEHEWRTLTRRHRVMTSGLLGATRVPAVRRLLVPAAQGLPAVFSGAVNALARPA